MKYKDLINQMTLEEKASLTSGADFWTTKSIDRLDIPSIYLSDGPHGIRKESSNKIGINKSYPATCFPTAATIANSWDIKLAEEIGDHLGKEALSQDVNILLGPGVNIKRNPLCGRNFEYFSEDPLLAGKLAAAYIRGIQSNGVSACIKHFAANNQEYRRMVINSIIDERALKEIYLRAFEIAIKEAKPKTVMSSYNMLNGYYTNENMFLMKETLRDAWNFKGLVVTDWGGMNDRVKGLEAYNSLSMPSNNGDSDREVFEAVKSGNLNEEILNENIEILLDSVFTLTNKEEKKDFDIEKHHLMAEKAALGSIVLLKNKDDILPLNSKDKIAIIGDFAETPRYQGAGSSIVNPTKLDNTVALMSEFDFNYIGYEPGFKRFGKKSKSLLTKAINLAKESDVILLYIGLDELSEVEGKDRDTMSLPENQLILIEELAKLNKKIIVVLSTGSAVELPFINMVDAILLSGLSGQSGAKAVLKILRGIINPSGKLSETYAKNYQDYPSSSYYLKNDKIAEYREGIFVGYRYFDHNKSKVNYPFGYGLSYSKFVYSNLVVEDNNVKFDLTNNSNIKGSEIVQLYVRAKDSKIYRPFKELRAFEKVSLEPNETKTVEIKISKEFFEVYLAESKEWVIENLDYEIIIASSSVDIELSQIIHVNGQDLTVKNSDKISSYYSLNVSNLKRDEFENLLGYKIGEDKYDFYKKNRLLIDYNTTINYLKYSPGFSGRLFAFSINFLAKFYSICNNMDKAIMYKYMINELPLRNLARMSKGKISSGQLDGLIMMFNGRFFKGMKKYFKEGKIRKERNKKS